MSVLTTQHHNPPRALPRVGWLIAVFYGGLTLVLLLVVTGSLAALLPGSVASKIAYNSEAYFFAIAVSAWIHLRITAPEIARRPVIVLSASAALIALGFVMLTAELSPRIVTLNEAAFAAGLMVIYIALPRPVPRFLPVAIFLVVAGVAAVAVAIGGDSWVINQAEAVGFVALLPVALDLVDRGILEPEAATRPVVRYAFYAALIGEPVVVSLLGTQMRQGQGPIALTLEFLGRIHESFFGVLLIVLFFAVVLGRTGRASSLRE